MCRRAASVGELPHVWRCCMGATVSATARYRNCCTTSSLCRSAWAVSSICNRVAAWRSHQSNAPSRRLCSSKRISLWTKPAGKRLANAAGCGWRSARLQHSFMWQAAVVARSSRGCWEDTAGEPLLSRPVLRGNSTKPGEGRLACLGLWHVRQPCRNPDEIQSGGD